MRLRERVVAHDEAGIAALCRELVELGVERVAIERPDGILVDRLLEAGLTVIAVHPNQAKAARERYSVAHGKSDRFDAFVLAELARTDAHRLRAIRPDSDETRALGRSPAPARTWSRRGSSSPTSCAPSSRPSGPGRWSSPTSTRRSRSPSWGATRALPTPRDSAPSAWPACFLATATAAAAVPRSCSSGSARRPRVAPASSRPRPGGRRCSAWSRRLSRSSPRSPSSPRRSAARLRAHPDAAIFRAAVSGPERRRSARRRLIAELGDSRERYPTEAALAADAGMSPVAVESGKRRVGDLPPRLRQAAARRRRDARRLDPPLASLGPRGLPAGPGPRPGPSPRDPHPRPRLAAGSLALLAGRRALRPGPSSAICSRLQPAGG